MYIIINICIFLGPKFRIANLWSQFYEEKIRRFRMSYIKKNKFIQPECGKYENDNYSKSNNSLYTASHSLSGSVCLSICLCVLFFSLMLGVKLQIMCLHIKTKPPYLCSLLHFFLNLFQILIFVWGHITRFQTSGGVTGEDFGA